MTAQDAFHRQGLFTGSGGLCDPGPTTRPPPHDEGTDAGWRSHATLSLRRSAAVAVLRPRSTFRRRFARGTPPRFHEGAHPGLGPRSLPPRALFEALCVSLFEARRRLDDFCNYHEVRALGPEPSRSSQGRRPRPPSFSYAPRRALAGAGTRGEPRFVRRTRPRCRFLPLARVCPTAMPRPPRHLRRISPGE